MQPMFVATGQRLALVALFSLLTQPLAGQPLPRPAGLEPDIGFWRRIFAEVTTDQALVHDNRYLGVVYEKVDMPTDASPAKLRRISEANRGKYERILTTLAGGKRQGLTSEESRVLRLWPEDVSSRELREAAGRVRFQQGLADRFHAGVIRSGQWQDHIRESLREAGVPEELAALPHVESSFNPDARSYVGAAGLWQFTSDTGRRFMQVDHVVDQRRDPYESSEAAARLLKYNYSILGTWPLAITAYNHGVGGMRKAVQQIGTDDIEVIVRRYDGRAFGFASRNFYVSFLAAHDIEQDIEQYFGPVQRKQPRNELVVELPDYMNVETLERAFGVSRSTLQAYNPALLPPVWEGAKYVPRGFRLRLPGGVIDAPPQQVLAAVPEAQRFAAQTPDRTHRVSRGETLSGIAARYRTSVRSLMAANGLRDARRIRVGQVLRLPVRGGQAPAPAAVAATPPETKSAAMTEAVAAAVGKTNAETDAEVYVVRSGDVLVEIARRTGVSEQELMALNGITNRNLIRAGQKLSLGRAAAPAPVTIEVVEAGKTAAPPLAVPAAPKTEDTPAEVATVASGTALPTIVLAPFLAVPAATAAPATAAPEATLASGDTAGTAASLADPSDYLVAADGSVEVQATETLSHYSDWLHVGAASIRKANGWSGRRQLVLGQRVRLVFDKVDRETFTARRVAHHRELQEAFFSRYRITDTIEHKLRAGESVWALAQQKYKVPVWLLRQYNPDLNFQQIRPGTRVVIPRLRPVPPDSATEPALADAA
jgi:membrane-bound lytic murein transglycosylase D